MSSVDSYIHRCLCHDVRSPAPFWLTRRTVHGVERGTHSRLDWNQIQRIHRHVINIPTATSYSFQRRLQIHLVSNFTY